MKEIKGSADVTTEPISGQPVLQVRILQDQVPATACPPARCSTSSRRSRATGRRGAGRAFRDQPVGEALEGQRRFPLAICLPQSLRSARTPSRVAAADGRRERIPLSRLADVEVYDGKATIPREWGKRRISIQCNVRAGTSAVSSPRPARH